jgi:hypothetical protein
MCRSNYAKVLACRVYPSTHADNYVLPISVRRFFVARLFTDAVRPRLARTKLKAAIKGKTRARSAECRHDHEASKGAHEASKGAKVNVSCLLYWTSYDHRRSRTAGCSDCAYNRIGYGYEIAPIDVLTPTMRRSRPRRLGLQTLGMGDCVGTDARPSQSNTALCSSSSAVNSSNRPVRALPASVLSSASAIGEMPSRPCRLVADAGGN